MPVDIGTGASVVFGTSSFTANFTSLSIDGITRISIPTSHLGTTTAHTFVPGDLIDAGEFSMEFQWDPDDYPPIEGAIETITISFPLSSGGSTKATFAFSGFMTNFSGAIPLEDLMTGSATVKITGDITDVDES